MTENRPTIDEVHILWITAGLGCDGDSVSITAATQPSIEDVLLGAIPGLPKVHLHNPVLAYTVGDEFLAPFHKAARGELQNFVLVLEGSIPNENLNKSNGGYFAGMGNNPKTGQPIKIPEWIDMLAPKALGVVAAGTCATYGGIHAMKGNPTGCMGVADYLGWDWKSKAGLPIVNVPGCPVQPDNFMETLLYLLRQLAGLAPMIPLDDAGRPKWLSRKPRGLRPRRLLRDRRFCHRVRLAQVHRQTRLLGPCRPVQCPQTGMDGRHGRMSQCRRHLHWLHDARFPRQIHAVHG
jgi:hydrogenase small subunit